MDEGTLINQLRVIDPAFKFAIIIASSQGGVNEFKAWPHEGFSGIGVQFLR